MSRLIDSVLIASWSWAAENFGQWFRQCWSALQPLKPCEHLFRKGFTWTNETTSNNIYIFLILMFLGSPSCFVFFKTQARINGSWGSGVFIQAGVRFNLQPSIVQHTLNDTCENFCKAELSSSKCLVSGFEWFRYFSADAITDNNLFLMADNDKITDHFTFVFYILFLFWLQK